MNHVDLLDFVSVKEELNSFGYPVDDIIVGFRVDDSDNRVFYNEDALVIKRVMKNKVWSNQGLNPEQFSNGMCGYVVIAADVEKIVRALLSTMKYGVVLVARAGDKEEGGSNFANPLPQFQEHDGKDHLDIFSEN